MGLKISFLILLLAVALISGCTQTPSGEEGTNTISDLARAECIQLCQNAFNRGQDLSRGPCLSDDNPGWDINDWACDVAHSPRQEMDNDPANQCREYREGRAGHFVELDPECNPIKAV